MHIYFLTNFLASLFYVIIINRLLTSIELKAHPFYESILLGFWQHFLDVNADLEIISFTEYKKNYRKYLIKAINIPAHSNLCLYPHLRRKKNQFKSKYHFVAILRLK